MLCIRKNCSFFPHGPSASSYSRMVGHILQALWGFRESTEPKSSRAFSQMSPSHVSGTLPTTDLTLADNSNVCGALGSCQILNLFLSSACSPTGDTGSLVSYQGDSLALTLGLYLLTTLSCLLSLRASVHLVTINNSYWTTSKFETLALQKALLRKVHKCHSQG